MRVLLVGCVLPIALAPVVACYDKNGFDRCTLTCIGTESCPSGLGCFDGLCRASSTDTCGAVVPDAQVTGDGLPPTDSACTVVGSLVTYCFTENDVMIKSLGPLLGSGDCTETKMQSDGSTVCVIAAGEIDIGSGGLNLTFNASKLEYPLALIARDRVEIDGDILVNGAGSIGAAGTNYGGCIPAAAGGAGGGAAGGSFAGTGGNGGGSLSPIGNQTDGATAAPAGPPTVLRGGCPGGMVDGSTGAPGGGAIYIASGDTINISSHAIVAGGAGGASLTNPNAGGAGGASGGMIMLDAVTLTGVVTLAADGGGGAGGNSGNGAGGAGEKRDPRG